MPNLNENFSKTKRNIDIVFCIDSTGSMGGIIDDVKINAKRFQSDLSIALTKANTEIESLRVKVISFKDYKDDDDAMVVSSFFELPSDLRDFEETVNAIDACGGGDNPENGLEALYYAMKSDFYTGEKDRQIIVLFTDADALELRARVGCGKYPEDMVDMKGLEEMWACVGQGSDCKLRERLKRLVVYAPKGTIYEEKIKNWNRVIYVPVNRDEGLKDIDFSNVIKAIVASATAV